MATKILIKTVKHAPEEVPELLTHAAVMAAVGRNKQQSFKLMPPPVATTRFGGNTVGLWTWEQVEELREIYGSSPRPMKRRAAVKEGEDNG